MEPQTRAGTCAIVGRPNVGKSTLMNRLLGEKLAVVTPKPQTTRNRILGVKNRPGAQLVLIDTPGIHRAKSSLNHYMVDQALAAVAECDVVLCLVEAPRVAGAALAARAFDPGEGNRAILDELGRVRRPRVLAINKVDLLHDKTALLPLVDGYARALPFDDIIPISAATGDGVDRLEEALAARLPVSPPLFPEEMLTDRAERFLAAELVREQTYLLLEDELPYSVAVTIESFEERAAKKDVVIDAVIHVERDSQKKIVVGEGGRMIKDIGTRARAEIGKLLDCPVHLRLHVKVDSDWTRDGRSLQRLGYD
ncbi:MAG TPA: GTPase Era [Haliangiales bacterium]|nr:GTPase Era [Haliangiales bacterium]